MSGAREELEAAWRRRLEWSAFTGTETLRIFHGPGEGSGDLHQVAIDRFGDHYWVTQWSQACPLEVVSEFLQKHGARSAVRLFRPEKGVPEDPEILFGAPPQARFEVHEGSMKFLIQLLGTKHPGLFLDHAPLRQWLLENARGATVLNTFAYTGSLSIAAALGGAAQVTTLDLSRPTIDWARQNWEANSLPMDRADFIYGDIFEWLPKFSKKGRHFSCVILDPPSFSRGKKGNFSTAKDLVGLHEIALDVLEPGGILASSINSANVPRKKFFADIRLATRSRSRRIEIIREIELPRTFPTRPSSEEDRYLKGWVLKVS